MFSVITEPVIPVRMENGQEKDAGIREIFENAHRIYDIKCSSPLERYAILRLLIAFAMDMLDLKNTKERKELFCAGKFSIEKFDAYVKDCESSGPRFDLFDKTHPFLQAGYDEKLDAKAEKPVAYLFPELPTGNNHVFWDHRKEDRHRMTPAQAFRGLCATYVFCMAGAQGYPSSVNNTPPVYVAAIGKNLFETIVWNMLSERECGNIAYGLKDVPWRQEEPVIPKEEFAEVTELGALTWMPRRITLKQDADGMIRRIYFQQGRNFKGNSLWKDPHVPYRKGKEDVVVSVKPELGRQLWRDVGNLVYAEKENPVLQPKNLERLGEIVSLDESYVNVRMTGLVTNQAQYVEWMEDEIAIPLCLMKRNDVSELFREDIAQVEAVQKIIYGGISKLMEESVADQARMLFLSRMHDLILGDVMKEMIGLSGNIEKYNIKAGYNHVKAFHKEVEERIEQTLRQTVDCAGNHVEDMKKQIGVRKIIFAGYKKLAKEVEEEYGDEEILG